MRCSCLVCILSCLVCIFECDTAAFICMDSIPGVHPTAKICQILRRYLEESGRQVDPPISIRINAPARMAEVPLQMNTCDCGVFLLKYASHSLDQHVRGFPIHTTRNMFRYYPIPNPTLTLSLTLTLVLTLTQTLTQTQTQT